MNEETIKKAEDITVNKPKALTKKQDFNSLLTLMKGEIQKALPKHLTVERMIRIAQTAYSGNSKLQECDSTSIIAGIVQASQLGLEVNTSLGQAYLIPYYNGKTKRMEAQFQRGYKGELSLAYRTNMYKHIGAYKVFQEEIDKKDGSVFHYEYGLKQDLKHIPHMNPYGEPVMYYAVYKLINGGEGFHVISRDQVEDYAKKYSQAYQKGWAGPWKTEFDLMAMKTCLKKLLNYAPKTIEYEKQFNQDDIVKTELSDDMTIIPNQIDLNAKY